MKSLLLVFLIISSFSAWAKCPDIQDSSLNKDQLIVKNLLVSAYANKNEGVNSKALTEFTELLKDDFKSASQDLNEDEIAAFIIEQDTDDNICANEQFISSKNFTSLISGKIIDTYYGCGCEH